MVLFILTIECNFLGAIFDRNVKLNSAILKYAVETANTRILADSDFELGYQDEAIEYGNEFEAAQTVCNLLKVIKCSFIHCNENQCLSY